MLTSQTLKKSKTKKFIIDALNQSGLGDSRQQINANRYLIKNDSEIRTQTMSFLILALDGTLIVDIKDNVSFNFVKNYKDILSEIIDEYEAIVIERNTPKFKKVFGEI